MEPIQHLLHPAAAHLVRSAPLSVAKVRCAWRLAVGTALARVSEPVLRDAGTLEATVDDARWARELEQSRSLIVERLQAALGTDVVRRIAVRSTAPDARPRPRAGAPKPSARR
jgi:predicted nucleic acid-binding Zn ribbon protein